MIRISNANNRPLRVVDSIKQHVYIGLLAANVLLIHPNERPYQKHSGMTLVKN